MDCLNCHNPINSDRANKKFCSDLCKSRFHRGTSKTVVVRPGTNPPANNQLPQTMFMGLSGNASFDYIFHKTEKENDQLKLENSKLKDSLETEKEKFRELKLKVDTQDKIAEADKAVEGSKGLGGIVDKVTSNERLMGLAEKLLIAKFGGAEEGTTDDVLEGLEENKMLLQTVVNLLREKDQEFLAHFIKVTQYFTLNPELLIAASNNIKKGKIQEKTA